MSIEDEGVILAAGITGGGAATAVLATTGNAAIILPIFGVALILTAITTLILRPKKSKVNSK